MNKNKRTEAEKPGIFRIKDDKGMYFCGIVNKLPARTDKANAKIFTSRNAAKQTIATLKRIWRYMELQVEKEVICATEETVQTKT